MGKEGTKEIQRQGKAQMLNAVSLVGACGSSDNVFPGADQRSRVTEIAGDIMCLPPSVTVTVSVICKLMSSRGARLNATY